MTRVVVACVCLVAVACADNSGAPPANESEDLAVVVDGGDVDLLTSADGGGTLGGDGAVELTPDLSGFPSPGDLGGAGASCTTACDCAPGLGCFGSTCVAGVQPVFCCEQPSATCPHGELCQHTNGSYGSCGGGSSPRDLGMNDVCRLVPCTLTGVARCVLAGCTMCVSASGGGGRVCAK
jgi:hypothetical protein